MRSEVVKILWSADARQCLLYAIDGHYEIHLRHSGRMTRLHICLSADEARRRAEDWRIALAAFAHSA